MAALTRAPTSPLPTGWYTAAQQQQRLPQDPIGNSCSISAAHAKPNPNQPKLVSCRARSCLARGNGADAIHQSPSMERCTPAASFGVGPSCWLVMRRLRARPRLAAVPMHSRRMHEGRQRHRRGLVQASAAASPSSSSSSSPSKVEQAEQQLPLSLELPRESSGGASSLPPSSSPLPPSQRKAKQQKKKGQAQSNRGSNDEGVRGHRGFRSERREGKRGRKRTVGDAVADVVQAFEDAPRETATTAAVFAGSGLAVAAVAATLLNSLDSLPLVPETLQMVGLIYFGFVAREQLTNERAELAPSPLPWLARLLRREASTSASYPFELPAGEDDWAGLYTPDTPRPKPVEIVPAAAVPAAAVQVLEEEAAAEASRVHVAPAPAAAAAAAEDVKNVLAASHTAGAEVPRAADSLAAVDSSAEAERESVLLELKVGARLRELAEQRDAALAQLNEIRHAEANMSRMVAEKEALEAVAVKLAEERDAAVSEVQALKRAVDAMTERMKGVEAVLADEVQRLQEQNALLESVALELADERDSALKQVAAVQVEFEQQREDDKKVLEMLAAQLMHERNDARREARELRRTLQHIEASRDNGSSADAATARAAGLALSRDGVERRGDGGTGQLGSEEGDSASGGWLSGLTPQMETFMRRRIAAVRSQFVDMSRPYDDQVSAVRTFVAHLVDEYGAPQEWTERYIREMFQDDGPGIAAAL